MKDIFGNPLRITPPFRGKWRLQKLWEKFVKDGRRIALLPDGSTVEVEMDIPYERLIWLQSEEWHELEYLKYRLRKNDTFVDVGANLGIWTLVAATVVGSAGRVFSFEPNPKTYLKLNTNVQRNGKSDIVKTFPNAVSRSEEMVSFSCRREYNFSAISDAPHSESVMPVEAVSLDSVLQGCKITGIKMDTEGHELACLEGAARTLRESSPWLIIEFNTMLLNSPILKDWEVFRFLAPFGYRPFIYSGPREATEITDSFTTSRYCNILFQR